jgi:para-nitrobenzyl esterase
MTATLVAFATSGNPSTGDVEWPAWSSSDERYVNFGDTITLETMNRTRMEFMAKHRPAPGPPGGSGRFPRG